MARPRHDDRAVAKRGGATARRRRAEKKAAKPALKLVMDKPRRARPVRDLDGTIRSLPGYDPFLQAGDCVFDPKAARKAIAWIETNLSHVRGELARKPLLLARWQRAIVSNLFGWKRPDGSRRYREAFLFLPRKQGKSVLAAALLLLLLFEDGEAGAEIYGAASEFKQACHVFDSARGMVVQNPELTERCTIYKGASKAIQLKDDFSTYRVLTSESASAHGGNTSAYAIDEVHALSDNELIEVLETSTGARRQPLGIFISTSDFEREGSPCNALHDRACKVRDGIIDDPSFLPVIYEAGKDDDWTDPRVWAKANPNLGVSVGREYIRSMCQKAVDSPAFENTFKRLHLNIRTAQDVRWLKMTRWDACAGEPLDIADFKGQKAWTGLDLSATRDLTAWVLCFPEADGRLALVPIFWIPADTARERGKKDRVPYLEWIAQGLIRTTPGDAVDYDTIRRDVNAIIDENKIDVQAIALDRLFQGDQLGRQLKEGDGLPVSAHGQGFLSMAAPTKRFEELILDGTIHHGGNPVLRWHASNVSVEIDAAGNMKPSRRKSSEKIDGIVSAIMAAGLGAARIVKRSVYEDRGLFFV